jgi:hypothetical protein
VTYDVDVKIDSVWGRLRAKLRSSRAANIALVISVTGVALWLVSQAVMRAAFALFALLLRYDDVTYGDARAQNHRPPIVSQRDEQKEPKGKNIEPQVPEQNSKLTEDRPHQNGGRKIAKDNPRPSDKRTPGLPLEIAPRLQHFGEAEKERPESEGDERAPSDPLSPNAYFKDGRFWIRVPFKCERYGNEPMYETCYYSPLSPNGRPIVKE